MSFCVRLGRMLRRTSDEPRAPGEDQRFEQRRRALGTNPLTRALYALLYAVDLAWPCVVRPRLQMAAGRVVVCDRYVYDAIVDYTLYTGDAVDALPGPLRWLERAAPRPDVRLLLDVEPDEALRRKPEEGGVEHLEQARSAFAALAARHDMDVVPDGRGPEAVQEYIARAALDAFYADYGTVLNRLLRSNPGQLNPRPGVR
jgi:thymidylate kinase